MPKKAVAISVSPRQRALLERLVRSRTASVSQVERGNIVLLSADGVAIIDAATELGTDRQRVRRWRLRWSASLPRLGEVEDVADDRVLLEAMLEVLEDGERSGHPPKFTAEQEERVRALACRLPAEFGLPHSQWTRGLLAEVAAREGIVDSISVAEVGRWLKKGGSNRTGPAIGSTRWSKMKRDSPPNSGKSSR
jgi:putative transposase